MKLRNGKRKAESGKAEIKNPCAVSFPLSAFPQQGSVLIVVLWIAIGLVSIALYFANAMTFELRASDNRASGLASEQAIEGAARYVATVLSNLATNGTVPEKTEFACEAVSLGEARYWLIGRDPTGAATSDPYFGLIDEGSKLNLNRVGTNTLSYLPNMTVDFAEAITDWRNTNGSLTLDYAQLGYEPKHDLFETVDELRLVDGATVDLLAGSDVNRNGILDASEKTTSSLSEQSAGLFEFLTVYSREPNFHSDGSALTNITIQTELRSLLSSAFGSTRAGQIMGSLGFGQGQPPTYSSLLGFYLAAEQRGALSSTDFAKIYDDATVTTNAFTRGRVNVNTANADVLAALFMGVGVDQNAAQSAAEDLVNYREQHTDNLGSISWIVDALGNNNAVITALASRDLVTTKSFQFTADGPFGRGYRRVKYIFDTSEGSPKIIYRQDLSRLGWALGEKARQTYVTMDTK
jgi:type II secretory pathway component PulK